VRNLGAAILFGLVLLVGVGTQPSKAFTICFTNNASSIIYLRAFSANRNAVWPASGGWVLDDRVERCATLACVGNEKICYGGTNNARLYWGVGFNGNMGCSSCCGFCGDVTYRWRLSD
jgi:hypothetical protein